MLQCHLIFLIRRQIHRLLGKNEALLQITSVVVKLDLRIQGLFGRAPASPKTASALAPLVERLF
jgi:hypothetical protein